MKNLIWCLMFISYLNLSYAQEKPDSVVTNSLVNGSWSIQFGIQSNFTLKDFKGSNISLKRHTTSNAAWRFGITLNGQVEDMDGDLAGYQYYEGLIKSEYDNFNMSINIQYLYYPHPQKNINLFFGLGPFIGFSNSNSMEIRGQFQLDTLYGVSTQERGSKGISIGFLILAGIEYFISKYISVHAEYSTSLSYFKSWEKDNRREELTDITKDDYYVNRKYERNRFSIYSNSVLFGLSVYF